MIDFTIKHLDIHCRLNNRNIKINNGKLCGFGNDGYYVGRLQTRLKSEKILSYV